MRKGLLLLLIVGCTLPALAGEQEVLFGGGVKHGGYYAPTISLTQMGDDFGVIVGSRFGWIINHRFVVGAGSYNLVGKLNPDEPLDAIQKYYKVEYSGLDLEYIFAPHRLVHISVHSLLGAGTVEDRSDFVDFDEEDDYFFVVEPGVNVTLNIHRFIRASLFADYRVVSDVDLLPLSDSDLNGLHAGLALQFGIF